MNKQKITQEKQKPIGLLNPKFKYIPAAATDVTQTWKKFGWTPIQRPESKT